MVQHQVLSTACFVITFVSTLQSQQRQEKHVPVVAYLLKAMSL